MVQCSSPWQKPHLCWIAYVIRYQFPSDQCETQKGDACAFPFYYDGKEQKHYKCTKASAGMPMSKSWCATRKTSQDHKYNDSDWGYCQEGCSTEGNQIKEIFTLNQNEATQ